MLACELNPIALFDDAHVRLTLALACLVLAAVDIAAIIYSTARFPATRIKAPHHFRYDKRIEVLWALIPAIILIGSAAATLTALTAAACG